jgi:hypothetical protein
MANVPEFKLTITVGDESQDFVLGAREVQYIVSTAFLDAPESAGVFAAAAHHPAAAVRLAASSQEHLPGDAALELATDPCANVRVQVVRNALFRRVAPEAMILALIESDPEVAAAVAEVVAQFENTDINVLCGALARHPDPTVRRTLADNDATPLNWLKKLRDDAAKEVADVALAKLAVRSR